MVRKTRKVRLLSFVMAMVLMLSLASTALAVRVPTDVTDAKDEIATVDITQIYNGKEVDSGVHNYAADGDKVNITYMATLRMTEEMATYLQARQGNLMDARFNVHVDMDMDLLEFAATGDKVTVTFSSTFLKPWAADGVPNVQNKDAFAERYAAGKYTSVLKSYDSQTGMFTYEITVDKAWAEKQDSFDIPMELIVYFDGTTAYSYNEVKAKYTKEQLAGMSLMYGDFEVTDWMAPITASLADMKVKDSVAATVTSASNTWKKVIAKGTVDGEFSYIGESAANSIAILLGYEAAGYVTTLEFGNDNTIEEWTSNKVEVLLKRQAPGVIVDPESPYLNLEDHFAYIIGYPVDYITGEPTDDMSRWPVKPEGTITRAEVATIFFRMLTDEVRNQYWSQTNPYNDVKLTDWYNNAISTLTKLGVIEGYPDGGFHPNAKITRAEFATMAVRFFIITEEYTWDEDAFTDIATHWANEYINLAYLLDIVDGYPDGTFKPQNAINRAEAMTIVNNTLRRSPCKEGIEPVEEYMITWPDNMNKNKWYYAAVQEATNSHEYTYFTEKETLQGKELWLEILPVRDWAAFERAWSDANSASNPGEVVGGH